jgi:hypothetical protein
MKIIKYFAIPNLLVMIEKMKEKDGVDAKFHHGKNKSLSRIYGGMQEMLRSGPESGRFGVGNGS